MQLYIKSRWCNDDISTKRIPKDEEHSIILLYAAHLLVKQEWTDFILAITDVLPDTTILMC